MALSVLGICNAETASACLMVDGVLVAAASEERFTRQKMDKSFPLNAVAAVLVEGGLDSVSDIDVVAYSWFKGMDASLVPSLADRIQLEQRTNPDGVETFLERLRSEVQRDIPKRDEFNHWAEAEGVADRLIDFYHHEAHALSAALLSPFDSGLVLTADARGDFESSAVWEFDRRRLPAITKRASSFSNDSLGFFYARITGLLGFRPLRHEGKVTGLAAHGNPEIARDLMQDMIRFEDGAIRAQNGDAYRPFFEPYSDELKARIRAFRKEDIAAAAQAHLEQIVAEVIRHHLPRNEEIDVALAGGVFANVRVNQVVKEIEGVRRVFVQPQMGDGGLCVGAAAGATHMQGVQVQPMHTAKLGPLSRPLRQDDIEGFHVTTAHSDEELIALVVERLAASSVIGVVRGRMEFGPRALCSRSILCSTSDVTVNQWLNDRLRRTEFMPFAPVTTVELAARSFHGFDSSDPTMAYMTSTIDCTEEFAAACPAVTHVDGTARPQIVTKDSDAFMHALLSAWHQHSGELSLINTSFNVHEEPIILDASQGLDELRHGIIDALLVDGAIIERPLT